MQMNLDCFILFPLFANEPALPSHNILQPFKTKLQQSLVIISQNPPKGTFQLKLVKEFILLCKCSESIYIITDHESHLLPWPSSPFPLPGISCEEGVSMGRADGSWRRDRRSMSCSSRQNYGTGPERSTRTGARVSRRRPKILNPESIVE